MNLPGKETVKINEWQRKPGLNQLQGMCYYLNYFSYFRYQVALCVQTSFVIVFAVPIPLKWCFLLY